MAGPSPVHQARRERPRGQLAERNYVILSFAPARATFKVRFHPLDSVVAAAAPRGSLWNNDIVAKLIGSVGTPTCFSD